LKIHPNKTPEAPYYDSTAHSDLLTNLGLDLARVARKQRQEALFPPARKLSESAFARKTRLFSSLHRNNLLNLWAA
jgi:hypothetical protein